MNHLFLNNEAKILIQLKTRSMNRKELAEAVETSPAWIGKSLAILFFEKLAVEDVGYCCPHCHEIIDSIVTKKCGRTISITEKGRESIKEIDG
jgi:hypothetical protein